MKIHKEEHFFKNWTLKPMVASAHLDINYIKGECVEKHRPESSLAKHNDWLKT